MEPEDASGDGKVNATLAKAAAQLQKLVRATVSEGIGPMTGSVAYADARLAGQSGSASGGSVTRRFSKTTSAPRDPGDATEAAIRRVIRESVAAAGTAGFVTGVGGLASLPVSLPANMAGNLIINSRMVGAIAHLRGYDLDKESTEALLFLVVAGSSAQSAMSALGVKIGKEAAKGAINRVPIAVIRRINQKAGFYLVAKYGTSRSAITLAKIVPGVGGVVGGSVDAALTRSIASVAKKVFPDLAGA